MEADVLNALQTKIAYLSGGRDRDAHLLIIITVPSELQPWTKYYLELCVKYLLSILSSENQNYEYVVIIDTQKCQWRLARSTIRMVTTLFGIKLLNLIVVRPDAFWDKQRVENCAKTHKKGEPIIISKSRLVKYFEITELPEELGGTLLYNHEQWIQNRVRIEEFKQFYEKILNDIENLHIILLESKSIRANETQQALRSCTQLNNDVQNDITNIITIGTNVIADINVTITNKTCLSQDLLDGRDLIRIMINGMEKKQTVIVQAWFDLEKCFEETRELAQLEEGISFVTNWILTIGEHLLSGQQKIGCDIQSCEELRNLHDAMEMQCVDTYGFYAELLHKIDRFSLAKDTFAHKDLMSQKEFMDFVCRSFATRLERRRNVLITSIRFYRLVSEYFDKTSEVFETLIMGHKVDDFDLASINLNKLKDNQQSLDNVVKELEKEGEKLSDILSMPVKDALGRDIGIDYSEDIASIRDILDATIARRNIFIDSVELQKLTLEQITYIHTYEKDAAIAIKWIDDLYTAMIKTHSHVGCNVYEIQMQKEELQTFQETAKGTYNYGCQLLDAALALRQSCKLNAEANRDMLKRFNQIWKHLQLISQEQMTRLRVSAVFHRSVEEHCIKLQELKNIVTTSQANATIANDQIVSTESSTTILTTTTTPPSSISDNTNKELCDIDIKRLRLRKYLTCREKLLVEVGRMVRLGRLLKTRLKEPFILDDKPDSMSDSSGSITPTSGNLISCDAITAKLTEVSRIAESLDYALRDTQNSLDHHYHEHHQQQEKQQQEQIQQQQQQIQQHQHHQQKHHHHHKQQNSLDDTNSNSSIEKLKCEHKMKLNPGGGESRGSNDEWNSSVKSSTEDESFITASECTFTPQSHSSSYRTASEGGITSPWWSAKDTNSFDADSSDADPEALPSMQLLSGVISSTSASFDDSEHSFLSAQPSPLSTPPSSIFNTLNKESSQIQTRNEQQNSQSSADESITIDISSQSTSSDDNRKTNENIKLLSTNNNNNNSEILSSTTSSPIETSAAATLAESIKVSANDDSILNANNIDNNNNNNNSISNNNNKDEQELTSWSNYCNVLINKHTIKGCI